MYTLRSNNCVLGLKWQFAIITCSHLKPVLRYVIMYIQVVLKDFTLSLPEGKVTALCGLSGAGKSTVAALLERFYEPQGGQIFIDEHPLENLDPSWVRGEVIGYINQEPVLFGTSVMDNIRYGRPNATDEEVRYIYCRGCFDGK